MTHLIYCITYCGRKSNDLEIVYESHEFIKVDFIYFSFSELYLDTAINDKMKIKLSTFDVTTSSSYANIFICNIYRWH